MSGKQSSLPHMGPIQLKQTKGNLIIECIPANIPFQSLIRKGGLLNYACLVQDEYYPKMAIHVKLQCSAENIRDLLQAHLLINSETEYWALRLRYEITPGHIERCDQEMFFKTILVPHPYYLKATLSVPKKYLRRYLPKHHKGSKHPFGKPNIKESTHYTGVNPTPFQGGLVSPK